MKTSEFRAMLSELAAIHQAAGDQDSAKALRKLMELFDGRPEQKITTFMSQIRVARGL